MGCCGQCHPRSSGWWRHNNWLWRTIRSKVRNIQTLYFHCCLIFLNSFTKFFYPRIECDEDGWLLTVNDEPPYQTFFHKFSPSLIKTLKVQGKVEISYVGIGSQSEGLSSAPPVGFNLTFVCPEGQVFSSDWFATPFVFMTCKEDGSFDEPSWDEYECVFRKFYHIWL